MYTGVGVCVCLCMCMLREKERGREGELRWRMCVSCQLWVNENDGAKFERGNGYNTAGSTCSFKTHTK